MDQTHILIVDDEPNIVRCVGAGLRAEGYTVTEARNGLEALQAVEVSSPDIVILDVKMPKMDGFETCRRIREGSLVPIIMLSGMSETEDKVRSLEYGADDYIVKPFLINELLARINSVLRRSVATR